MEKGELGAEVPEIEKICLLFTDVDDCYKLKDSLINIVSFTPAWATELEPFSKKKKLKKKSHMWQNLVVELEGM